MIVLETHNVTKKFGGLTAVNEVSMTLFQGDVMGLIGPNGAGKTTFINAISGLNPPTSGTVKVLGKDTHEPCCQVLHGVTTGAIKQDRLDSYHKMRRELAYLSDRQTKSSGRVEKERWKEVALKIKAIKNRKINHA